MAAIIVVLSRGGMDSNERSRLVLGVNTHLVIRSLISRRALVSRMIVDLNDRSGVWVYRASAIEIHVDNGRGMILLLMARGRSIGLHCGSASV